MNRILGACFLLAFATPALAANPHQKTGNSPDPGFTQGADSLSYTVCLTGLGEGDLTATIDGQGDAELECIPPRANSNDEEAPGQHEAIDASGTETFPAPKNGNVCITIETDPVEVPFTCPNSKWTQNADITWTSGTVTITQEVDGAQAPVWTDSFGSP